MRALVGTSLYVSGRGNWVAEQVRSLRDAGVDIDVLFFNTRETRWRYASSIPRIATALRTGAYDLIHTHHSYTVFGVLAAKRLARSRLPLVFTNHEGEVLNAAARTLTWHPTSRLRNSVRVKRYAARWSDFVIFVSRHLVDRLGFVGRYAIIPCGVDLGKFRPLDREQCRARVGIPRGAFTIFFPADPANYRKRFALAKDAYAIVRREEPEALLLTGGRIDSDDMPYYYGASDVVVQTSFFEASPTVVKEALACEVPVVSTDVGDTRDMLDGIPACAVSPDDPGEIAARLLAARGRPAAGGRARLTTQGLDLPQVARRIIGVYEQAAG